MEVNCTESFPLVSVPWFVRGKPLRVRPEPTQVELISGSSLEVRLLSLGTSIRQYWKGLLGTNALAYVSTFGSDEEEKVYRDFDQDEDVEDDDRDDSDDVDHFDWKEKRE